MGFPSPASDYVERVLSPASICTTADSRILETSSGYAVVDPVTRLVQGEVLLILCGGRTQFAKFMVQSLICDDDEAIEGAALQETVVMGRVSVRSGIKLSIRRAIRSAGAGSVKLISSAQRAINDATLIIQNPLRRVFLCLEQNMSAGTIALTNNSAVVTGTGTDFTTDLKANDFIVVIVGGVTYTLGVKATASATSLTLITPYGGPTATGNAWTAVPNATLVGITAQVAADVAKAIRGLNLDKANWQQVYSNSGNITLTLLDGSNFTGPSWNYLANNAATKVSGAVPVNQGGTGATSVGGAKVGFGIDGVNTGIIVNQNNIDNYINGLKAPYQLGVVRNNTAITGTSFNTLQNAACLFAKVSDTWLHITVPHVGSSPISVLGGYGNVGVAVYRYLWDNFTTTVDTNGFIKKASPIVKLFSDGRTDVSEEARGCSVTRVAKGEYLIEGCSGLNSDAAWGGIDGGFELPKDKNGLPHIWLDYDVSADGSVTVKTYHREHPNAPAFARNNIEGYQDGDPIDIPSDQFVSVRVQMPQDSLFHKEIEQAQSYFDSKDAGLTT